MDCVFHLAGKAHAVAEGTDAAEEYRLANCQSTCDLLAAARVHGVRGFVYFSSVKAMGEGTERPIEARSGSMPATPYGRSKLAAE